MYYYHFQHLTHTYFTQLVSNYLLLQPNFFTYTLLICIVIYNISFTSYPTWIHRWEHFKNFISPTSLRKGFKKGNIFLPVSTLFFILTQFIKTSFYCFHTLVSYYFQSTFNILFPSWGHNFHNITIWIFLLPQFHFPNHFICKVHRTFKLCHLH